MICALLFLAATLNYVDRQVIGFLKPTLQQEFGWSEMDYADIVFAFQIAYAIGLLVAGRMMDRLGTRLGFALAIVIWSVAAMAHAEATWFGPGVAAMLGVGLVYSGSVAGFMAARFVLGLGEAGNFPASIKTVAEWFPKKERALATGIFNSGTNVGALLVAARGAVDHADLRLVLGVRRHRRHRVPLARCCGGRSTSSPSSTRGVSAAELAYIQSDPPDPAAKVPLRAGPAAPADVGVRHRRSS